MVEPMRVYNLIVTPLQVMNVHRHLEDAALAVDMRGHTLVCEPVARLSALPEAASP